MVVAIRMKAGGVVEIVEALDHRVIHPLAMIRTTELRNQGQRATGVRKRGTGSKIATDISQRKRGTRVNDFRMLLTYTASVVWSDSLSLSHMLSTALLLANSMILPLYTGFIDPDRIAMACPRGVMKDWCCLTCASVGWMPNAGSVSSPVTICQAPAAMNASMQESLNSE
jgi:hypothetical protein